MINVVPTQVTDRFGSRSARPKIIREYMHTTGWQKVDRHEVLTWDLLEGLRGRGVTRIELAWRFKRRELSVSRIGRAPAALAESGVDSGTR